MSIRTWQTLGIGVWVVAFASAWPVHGQVPPAASVMAIGGALTPDLSLPVAPAAAPSGAYLWRGHEALIEDYLRRAPITHFTQIPVGITKPRRGYFAVGGPVRSMAWKPLTPGLLHGKMESYRSEIAAYLLSRHLGLHMVPPVVERQLGGVKGAAVYWIDGVRPWNPVAPPKLPGAKWSRQTSRMLMFDQLIANSDRNQGNLLYDDAGHLYLIDHSRAFITQPMLGAVKPPQQFDRELWTRMAALTRADLEQVLTPWVDGLQISALLRRRDEMRKYIDRQVKDRGASVTFLPTEPLTTAALR